MTIFKVNYFHEPSEYYVCENKEKLMKVIDTDDVSYVEAIAGECSLNTLYIVKDNEILTFGWRKDGQDICCP